MDRARAAHPRTARNNERAYEHGYRGAGGSNVGAYSAFRSQRSDPRYSAMMARHLEMTSGPVTREERRARRMDSEFNRLYTEAQRQGFARTRFGAYHRLLVYLGWRQGGKDTPRWGAGNTPRAHAPMYTFERSAA